LSNSLYTPRASNKLGIILTLVITLASLVIGLSLALGIYIFPILILILVTGLVLIVYPKLGLWATIIGALVFAGLIDLYMPSLKPLVWGISLLSYGVAGVAVLKPLFIQTRNNPHKSLADDYALLIWVLMFILIACFSTLANWHGFKGALLGLKSYFQIWGLMVGVIYLVKSEIDAKRLISFFLILGIFQLPFLLHQFLVLVPKRTSELFASHGVVAGDVVAGTFGGSMMGGGRSPDLALLCMFCITLMLAKWRSGYCSTRQLVVAMLFFIFPMFISQVTLFIVLLPIAIFLLFRDRILINPLKSIAVAVALVVLAFSIFFVYSLLPSAKSQQEKSIKKSFTDTLEYNLGKKGYGNSVLNRTTVYPFWLKEHAHGDTLVPLLIGHGPGATSGGAVVQDKASLGSTRYRGYGIGLTGLSSLLWEVGLLGTFIVLAMLVSAYRLAGRLATLWQDTEHWAGIKATQIAIPLFAVSLLHINYFVFDLSYQTMLVIMLAYLLVMRRFLRA
jgi:hypothetical protein